MREFFPPEVLPFEEDVFALRLPNLSEQETNERIVLQDNVRKVTAGIIVTGISAIALSVVLRVTGQEDHDFDLLVGGGVLAGSGAYLFAKAKGGIFRLERRKNELLKRQGDQNPPTQTEPSEPPQGSVS